MAYGAGGNFVYDLNAVNVTAGTPVTLATPAAGMKVRVIGYHLSLSVAGAVILKDGGAADAVVMRTALMAALVGQSSPNLGQGAKLTTAGGTLRLDVSATGSVTGFVVAVEEP